MIYSVAVYAQTETAIYSIIGASTINVNSSFVESFYSETTATELPSYSRVNLTGMNATYGDFNLKLHKFIGYQDEPGFANVIHICRGETVLVTLKSSNGFAALSSYVSGITGNFLFKKLADDTYALVFTEWIYASQPPMVSVVLIYKNNAKLIFNKKMFINSIILTPFEMELQSNTVEYINNSTSVNTADIHRIWWKDNVLKYK